MATIEQTEVPAAEVEPRVRFQSEESAEQFQAAAEQFGEEIFSGRLASRFGAQTNAKIKVRAFILRENAFVGLEPPFEEFRLMAQQSVIARHSAKDRREVKTEAMAWLMR